MSRRGSQLVEFALLMPIVLTITAGVIDLGTFISRTNALVAAASDGARVAAASDEDPASIAVAHAQAAWASTDLSGTANFTASLAGADPVRRVDVEVTYAFTPWFGLVPLPDTIEYACSFRLDDQDL